jgi:hypothetical protein
MGDHPSFCKKYTTINTLTDIKQNHRKSYVIWHCDFRYAHQYLNTHHLPPSSRLRKWKDTDEAEMRRFLALTIAIGLTHQEDLSDYWSTDEVIETPFYAKVISRDRFLNLLAFFHLADNVQYIPRGVRGHDPLFKLGTVYRDIINSFRTLWQPSEQVAIDEGLVPFSGHIKFKVFNPAKPKKYGIKSYQLCDGNNAYCLKYELYCGAVEDVSGKGKTYDIVMKLMDGYLYAGRVLYVDNFYTSPILFHDLALKSNYATGTARFRKGL